MRMNYVPKQSRDHADSEDVSHVGVDRERAEFIANKQTDEHTDTYLYILVHVYKF